MSYTASELLLFIAVILFMLGGILVLAGTIVLLARTRNKDVQTPFVVKDMTGAGDTFLAGLVAKFLETYSIPLGIQFGNECATEVVQKRVPDARLRMLTFFDEGVEYPVKDSIAELLQNVQRGAA